MSRYYFSIVVFVFHSNSFYLELYGHNQLPQICFIIVKKRHNTRFFTWDKQSNQTNNIQPGKEIGEMCGIVMGDGWICF